MPTQAVDSARPLAVRILPAQGLLEVVRGVVSAGGSLWIQVTGISMNPVLREGDSVLLERLARPPQRWDVVFLDVEGRPLLHRVRRCDAGVVVTRGDAALTEDAPVPPSACVAHAVAVRRGAVTVPLTLTLRFGVKPLLWSALWGVRVRLPQSVGRGVKPLSRAIVRSLS